ncbi:MAG: peptidylprolyl isomerase [Longimicrobiales bacterium]
MNCLIPAIRNVSSILLLGIIASCSSGSDDVESGESNLNPLLYVSRFREDSPDYFKARFTTTKGDFVVEVYSDWAPLGSARFYNLVKQGWYNGVRFHRVLEDFTAGWGIHDDPYVNFVWQKELLPDDPPFKSNTKGRLSFARSGPNSRTTQIFVNYKDNSSLDESFVPFGEILEGIEVVENLYAGYGDGPPRGEGVYQAMAIARGQEYFEEEFPELDRITTATILEGTSPKPN